MVGLEWYPCCRLQPATRIPLNLVYLHSTIKMMHGPINLVIKIYLCNSTIRNEVLNQMYVMYYKVFNCHR